MKLTRDVLAAVYQAWCRSENIRADLSADELASMLTMDFQDAGCPKSLATSYHYRQMWLTWYITLWFDLDDEDGAHGSISEGIVIMKLTPGNVGDLHNLLKDVLGD